MMGFWLIVGVVAGASALVTAALGDSPVAGLWWAIAPGGAVAAVALGLRRHAPAHRLPWGVLLASLVALWSGWAVSGWLHAVPAVGPPEGLALARDLLYLGGYTGVGVAALLAVRVRTGGADRDSLIDGLVVMLALAMVLWVALPDRGGSVADLAASEWAWRAAAPLLMAAVIGATVRVLFAGRVRLAPAWLLFAAATLVAAGNVWAIQRLAEGVPAPYTGADVLWTLAYAAIGAAALHPAMRELTTPVRLCEQSLPTDRIALLGAALLAPPVVFLQLVEDLTVWMAGLVTGSVAVSLLVMWRMVRLLADREHARRALHDAADRDAALAALGRLALDDRPLHRLLSEADTLVRNTIGGARCAVVPAGATTVERAELGEPRVRMAVDDGTAHVADVVAAVTGPRELTAAEREFLATVAALLSAAARQRTAEARLRHQALHDDLTGLPGRALLLERLRHLLMRRDPGPVTVLFVDLDDFKAINDRYGHPLGDEVLERLGRAVDQQLRSGDVAARLGGDEFALLLGDAHEDAVSATIERLRQRLDRFELPVEVSLSWGWVACPQESAAPEEVYRIADTRLYQHKRRSRSDPEPAGAR